MLVHVCERERERERESFTASLHCLVSMISGGGFCKYLLLHVQWRMIKGTRGGQIFLKISILIYDVIIFTSSYGKIQLDQFDLLLNF